MLRIGDIGRLQTTKKEVKIIAITEDDEYVCRYTSDINGRHPNRCYIYDRDKIIAKEPKLVTKYEVEIYSSHGVGLQDYIVVKVPYEYYPNKDVIRYLLEEHLGKYAIIKTKYILEK
ncbi:MAG: hypothetical protein M0Q88_08675 [Bacilli bacterium]|nr:hypothetical protein [Bacilli bacterium]